MPFTLPLDNVCVFEGLLSLRFNLHIGTMYVEQEMYFEDGWLSEIIYFYKRIGLMIVSCGFSVLVHLG